MTHGKKYNGDEELMRFDIWRANLKFISKHNAEADEGKHTFWVGMNKFGDLVSVLIKN